MGERRWGRGSIEKIGEEEEWEEERIATRERREKSEGRKKIVKRRG